ncbi:Mitochondrial import receptor subunit TOM22 [Cichlidogyrus casuarinus]|uniref:Mitochondrial import receptor subunit TOM22 homolog n=1 Tax=Cichlidogyrus casuarinus TaxID=1844966 RepID=A0ABD2QI76_9PLAT
MQLIKIGQSDPPGYPGSSKITGDTSSEDGKLKIIKQIPIDGGLFQSEDDESDYEDVDFEDETVLERIIALKEMFPDAFRNKVHKISSVVSWATRSFYKNTRAVAWIGVSIATICFLPLAIELEREQMEEQEAVQQRTMMLGPQVVQGGSNLAGFSATLPNLVPGK